MLVIIGMFACSCSQILLKNSARKIHSSFFSSILNWQVVFAYGIFFLSMIVNIYAMQHGLYLKELPALEASSYIFVPILSFFFLKEKIRLQEFGAMILIFVGIIIFYV